MQGLASGACRGVGSSVGRKVGRQVGRESGERCVCVDVTADDGQEQLLPQARGQALAQPQSPSAGARKRIWASGRGGREGTRDKMKRREGKKLIARKNMWVTCAQRRGRPFVSTSLRAGCALAIVLARACALIHASARV